MAFEINDTGMDGFTGVTAGAQAEERWNYPPVGYKATTGVFFIGEEQFSTLEIIPFAMRQCKEVEDADGVIHRYPIRTRKTDMVKGDAQPRLQVVGLVNGELRIFGARSWATRAAWANPLSGTYHDARFEGGLWPRLDAHIKQVKADRGIQTAPLCYKMTLATGKQITLVAKSDPRKSSPAHPIIATAVTFVGADQAAANARLYTDEALDEWIAEWNKSAIAEPVEQRDGSAAPVVQEDELVPF